GIGRATALPASQRADIVRAAGLGSRPHRGSLPSAEWLPAHHRPGDGAIDVCVTNGDALDPMLDLVGIETEETAGEPERHVVLQRDRVIEVFGTHDTQHGTEALRAMEE